VSVEQIAVVTGAGGGLGGCIARRLHAEGCKVVLTDIAEEPVAQLAAQLSADGATAFAMQHDVSSRQDFEKVLDAVRTRWSVPTVLVNNAAMTQAKDVLSIEAEEFNRVLTTNTDSIFYGCQVIGAAMAQEGYGRIINMASLAGQNGGTATGAHYAASKGAILTLTKIFAKQFAAAQVTVNAISPGPQDLPIVRQTVPADKLEAVLASIPVGRLGSPEYVAKMVALLADEEAFFVTGACWDVNGGLFVR